MAKILIVDDEKGICNILKLALSSEGYEVFVAYNGKEALERLYTVTPDLMILDIIMPEMNGYEVCSRVEKDQFFKELPIIILSSENDVKEKLDVFNPGTYTHIEKPFNLHELIPKVKALIESKKK